MKWTQYRIKTISDAEDIIISTLYDIRLEGAQIEDKVPLTAMEKEQMFVDIMPDGPADDGIAYLSFFVEEEDASPEEHEKNVNISKLIEGKHAIVGNKRYSGNDYETFIEYKLDGKYQTMYIFYIEDLLVIQVGLSDEGPKFIAYK